MSEEPQASDAGRVLSVHFGRSANCSSIGSIVDFLFLSTVAASALVAATAALLGGSEDRNSPTADPESPEPPVRPGEGEK